MTAEQPSVQKVEAEREVRIKEYRTRSQVTETKSISYRNSSGSACQPASCSSRRDAGVELAEATQKGLAEAEAQ